MSQSFISQVTAESQGIDMEFCVLQLSFVICIILQGFTYTMNYKLETSNLLITFLRGVTNIIQVNKKESLLYLTVLLFKHSNIFF